MVGGGGKRLRSKVLAPPGGKLSGIKLPSAQEMAAFDAATIDAGTPSLELMERAGKAVLSRAAKQFPKAFTKRRTIVILCGPGNNGGDGLVIARHLLKKKQPVEVILTAAPKYSKDCVSQARAFAGKGGEIKIFPVQDCKIPGVALGRIGEAELKRSINESTLVFDSLLGTGQRSAPRGAIGKVVSILNSALKSGKNAPAVVSVDLPTGIDSGTGAVYPPAVSADLTVSIQLPKRGMIQSPALECCGEVAIVDIGIGTGGECEFSLLTSSSAPRFPRRTRDAHKGRAGRVLIVGGSRAMTGAPLLAGLAALRTGAGLVTSVVFSGAVSQTPRALEIIDLPLEPAESGGFSKEHIPELRSHVAAADVVIFGPGIGRSTETVEFSKLFIRELQRAKKPAVIDADALMNLASIKASSIGPSFVVTPHPGEAAALLGSNIDAIQADRYGSARALSKLTRSSVVLKGASSIVYSGKHGFVNSSGNRWMATAGSGDVLCGVIAALAAQGLEIAEAAKLGVFLHGGAGDRAHDSHGGPIIASDIAAALPQVIGKLLR